METVGFHFASFLKEVGLKGQSPLKRKHLVNNSGITELKIRIIFNEYMPRKLLMKCFRKL